jgi:methionyl-tRNA formyltransferase
VRTVFLGTSDFAAAVLERLAASPHRPALVVSRPDRPKGRGRRMQAPPVAVAARRLKLDVIGPEQVHDPAVLARIAAAEPEILCVCAFGVLLKAPLLDAYELLNVHPSLLPRWRGAAPIERALLAGDRETGVSIMQVTAGVDSGPVCLQEPEPIRPDDDYGSLAARLQVLGGELLVEALDEPLEFVEQDELGVTYAAKIEAADRALDPSNPPDVEARRVRALRPHIGARLPLPDGTFLGVLDARNPSPPTRRLQAAGGRVRCTGERLLLDCRGGALELLRILPPGGRSMPARDWLRGRPDEALTSFWLDPALPGRPAAELAQLAVAEHKRTGEWAPHAAALAYRGDAEALAALCEPAAAPAYSARAAAAAALGQLGQPARTSAAECAAALTGLAADEHHPEVLAAVAAGFGFLGEPHGLGWLLKLARHADPEVRDAAAHALAGRSGPQATQALVGLAADPDPAIRGWATFALADPDAYPAPGAPLTTQSSRAAPEPVDTAREALARRLYDADEDVRVAAVYGLALRDDARAREPLASLVERGVGDDEDPLWKRHAMHVAVARLAELTADPRLLDAARAARR